MRLHHALNSLQAITEFPSVGKAIKSIIHKKQYSDENKAEIMNFLRGHRK